MPSSLRPGAGESLPTAVGGGSRLRRRSADALSLASAYVALVLLAHCTPEGDFEAVRRAPLAVVVSSLPELSKPLEVSPEGSALTQLFELALESGEGIRPYPAERAVILELEGVLTGSLEPLTMERLRRLTAADAVLVGSWETVAGGGFRVEVELMSTAGGRQLARATAAGSRQHPWPVVANAVRELQRGVGRPRLTDLEIQVLQGRVDGDLTALGDLAAGRRQLWLSDPAAAIAPLERARDTDSELTLPRIELARALSAVGLVPQALNEVSAALSGGHNPAAERLGAERLDAERLDAERLDAEALRAQIGGRMGEAVEKVRQRIDLDPDHPEPRWTLLRALIAIDQTEDAATALRDLRTLKLGLAEVLQLDLIAAELATAGGRLDLAEELARGVQRSAEELGLALTFAQAKTRLAAILIQGQERTEAEAIAREARELFLALSHRRQAASALALAALAQSLAGDSEAARSTYRQAVKELRSQRDPRGLASALSNLAALEARARRFRSASRLYEEAVEIRSSLKDEIGASRTLRRWAQLELRRGELQLAGERYQAALNRLPADVALAEAAQLHLAMGRLSTSERDLATAESRFREALARAPAGSRLEAEVRRTLADNLTTQGKLESAGEEYRLAMALFASLGRESDTARTRLELARLALETDRPSEAEVLAREALETFLARGHLPAQATARAVLSWALLQQGRVEAARRQLQRAGELSTTIDDPGIGLTMAMIEAHLEAATGEVESARATLEEIAREAGGRGLTVLVLEVELALGELDLQSGASERGAERLLRVEDTARASGLGLLAARALAARKKADPEAAPINP